MGIAEFAMSAGAETVGALAAAAIGAMGLRVWMAYRSGGTTGPEKHTPGPPATPAAVVAPSAESAASTESEEASRRNTLVDVVWGFAIVLLGLALLGLGGWAFWTVAGFAVGATRRGYNFFRKCLRGDYDR